MKNNTTIYLCRHGEYENHDEIIPFRLPGFHLSQNGKKQAETIAAEVKDKNIAAVFTSPMERTRETAEIIAHACGLNVQTDARLNEVRSPAQGEKEGFIEKMGGWEMYNSDWYKKNNGETPEEVTARMDSFMSEKISEFVGKSIVVVSHGDPIMMYLRKKTPYIQKGEYLPLAF